MIFYAVLINLQVHTMNPELRRERWNLDAEAIERRSERMKARIHHDPGILVAAFLEAGGDWLQTAQFLSIVFPVYWTGEQRSEPVAPHNRRARITELAEKVAPPLLDPESLSTLALEP